MRSRVEQFAGLEKIVEAAAGKQDIKDFLCKVAVTWWVPDVVTLELPEKYELIYASANGGYDLWIDGHLKKPDLSFDEAVNVILTASAHNKVNA